MGNIIIERIEVVSFGKLKMVQVIPTKGINLLSASNESGKSTLSAFVKFVFYGYTNGRVQSIIDNDKKLYTPWENPQSEGALYIKTDDGRFKIVRKYLQSGKESLEIFEIHTGKLLNPGVSPGEHFFGVNDQVFEKTAFFKQLTIPSGKDEYIAEQLQNIAMSADEKINSGKALKRLTEARNMLLGRGKSGFIPKLEIEREELKQRFTDAVDTNRQIQELADKIAESRRLISDNNVILKKLYEEKENITKYEAAQRLTQLKELERNELKTKHDYEESAKLVKKSELPNNSFITTLLSLNADYKMDLRSREKSFNVLQMEEEELKKLNGNVGADRDKAEALKKQTNKKRSLKTIFIIVSTLLILGGAGVTVINPYVGLGLIVMGIIACIIIVTIALSLKKLLKSYGVKSLSELNQMIGNFPLIEQRIMDKKNRVASLNNGYSELLNRLEENKKQLEAGILEYMKIDHSMSYEEQIEYISDTAQKISQKLNIYKTNSQIRKKAIENVNLTSLTEEALGAVKPEREKSKVDNQINFYTQQMKIYQDKERENERQKAMLEGRGSDPAVLMGKRDAVKVKLDEYKKKYASLELAISMLSEANDYMKSTVAPRINTYASDFFGNATNGKYNTLSIDTSIAMNFADKTGIKSCDYLSAGTRDSAYLCLRFALIKLLYGGINPPIILDDAFGRLDDERLEALLSLLSEANSDSQTFIFTCGDREQKLLEKCGKAYTLLSLQEK